MPIYNYKCTGCGEIGEYLLKIGQEPDYCENCSGSGPFTRTRMGETPSLLNSTGHSKPEKDCPGCKIIEGIVGGLIKMIEKKEPKFPRHSLN